MPWRRRTGCAGTPVVPERRSESLLPSFASPPFDRHLQQLDRVVHGKWGSGLRELLLDLERAAGVSRSDGRGTGGVQIRRLAAAEFIGRLGLQQVVDARRSAADLPFRRLDKLQA